MKPRTKREREVVELSRKLPSFEQAEEWAKDHIFPHEAYKCKNELWCSDCGGMWVSSDEDLACNNGSIECPYCHHKLEVKVNRSRKSIKRTYMTIVTTCGSYQTLRHIYCERRSNKRSAFVKGFSGNLVGYYFNEVVQEWINSKGEYTVMARPLNMGSTGWMYARERSIKTGYKYNGYYGDPYALSADIYPQVKMIGELKKRGINKKALDSTTPSRIIREVLTHNSNAELCIKTKQYNMLKHISHGYYRLKYKPSFNICNRNHYIIKDASMWEDYISLLEFFNKDIRNAHYVCPKNLKQEHDILLRKKQKIEAELARVRKREKAKRKAIEAKKDMLKFYQNKIKFFGLEIKGNGIIIRPLESVTQFYLEAKAMHHCVFSCKYFAKPESLILSARDSKGNRLETVEINLNTMGIVQSRAVHNGETKKHKDIIDLIKKNVNLIKQRVA